MYRYMGLVGDDEEDALLNDMPMLGPERKMQADAVDRIGQMTWP